MKESSIGQALYQVLFNGRPLLPLVSEELLKLADTIHLTDVADGVSMLALADEEGVTRVLLFGRQENLQGNCPEPLPAVFYTPGGCWAFPNLALKTIVHLMALARSGKCWVAIPVTRLSGEADHEEMFNDVLLAHDLLVDDARVDQDRMIFWGHSSGGQLVGKLAMVRRSLLTILWSAPLDPRTIRFWNKETVLSYFFAKRVLRCRPRNAPESCTMFSNLDQERAKSLSPFIIMHGQNDFAVDHEQSVQAVRQLQALGVDVTFRSLPTCGHYLPGYEDGSCVKQVYAEICSRFKIDVPYTTTAAERKLQHTYRLLEPLLS